LFKAVVIALYFLSGTALAEVQTLSGRVTNSNGVPFDDVAVDVLDDSGSLVGFAAFTNDNGEWNKSVPGSGTYYVRTVGSWTIGYQPEIWNNIPCDGCDPLAVGTPIAVNGEGAAGIDFELASKAGPPTACQLRQLEIIFGAGFENEQEPFECKRLQAVAGEGGSIVSTSGDNDCRETLTCEFDIGQGNGFTDTFTAQPRSGYLFSGWKAGETNLCTDTATPCTVEGDSGQVLQIAGDPVIEAIFEPDGTVFSPRDEDISVCSYVQSVDSDQVSCETRNFLDYGHGSIESFTINNPNLFIDIGQRHGELSLLSEQDRKTWCVDGFLSVDYSTYTSPPLEGLSDANRGPIWDMFNTLVAGREHYQFLENDAAGGMILRSLKGWAEAEMLLDIDYAVNPGVSLDFKLGMVVYVLAWHAIRDMDIVSPGERELIENYLHKLVVELSWYEGQRLEWDSFTLLDIFNHSWKQDVSLMAYGILTGNNSYFRRAIRKYFAILDGLVRPDGSHFFESQRGGAALGYSVGATNIMIRIAQLAATQGYNLYDVEIDGISLHTVMDFHVGALEDNELIHQYTQYQNPLTCNPEQCANWDNQNFIYETEGGGLFQFGDFEIYRRRYPDSSLIDRYLALFPDTSHTPVYEGPLFHTCEFRAVP